MKKTSLVKKPKRKPITKLKKEAWDAFSKFIRLRDCLVTQGSTEFGSCITCGRVYHFKELQAGHFVDSRTKPVLFNEDIVYAQCYGCNIPKKGNKDAYTPKMVEMFGTAQTLEFLELRHNKDKTWTRQELEDILALYTRKYAELLEKND